MVGPALSHLAKMHYFHSRPCIHLEAHAAASRLRDSAHGDAIGLDIRAQQVEHGQNPAGGASVDGDFDAGGFC